MTTNPPEPACQSAEGCHRVVACDPGCAVTTARLHEQLAAVSVPASAPTDQTALAKLIAEAVQGVLPMSSSLACAVVADAVLAVLPVPADRAAILREAADHLETLDPTEAALAGQHAWADAARELRRVAGEAQQPETADEELTAEEARALVDQMGLDLYRAQDAIEFARECCDIADREQQPITTADVREWLKGDRCTRQRAADEAQQPAAVPQPDRSGQ